MYRKSLYFAQAVQNRSTLTALLTVYDRWVKAAAAGKISLSVFLDLSAAFDLVDPTLLLQKNYGLNEDSLKWILSYLHSRHQAVWVHSELSEFLES